MHKIHKNLFQALHFEITHKCNLRCLHCYNIGYLNAQKQDLSLSDVKKVIDISATAGCEHFGFSGGEPFMRKDFLEIIDYAPGPVHILTNSVIISETQAKMLQKMNKLIEFRISLDGLASHKIIRAIDCKKVIEKIKLIRSCDFITTINTMLTPYNIDELPAMYELMDKIRVDRWRIDFIFHGGNAALNKVFIQNNKQSFASLKNLIAKYLQEKPSFDLDINKFFRSTCLEGIKRMQYSPYTKVCGYQKALTIRPDGEISFCPSLDTTFGNILKTPLKKIVNSEKWKAFSNIRVNQIKKCLSCKLLSLCGGGCRADAFYTTKSFFEPDNFTCQAMKYFHKNIQPIIEKHQKQKTLN